MKKLRLYGSRHAIWLETDRGAGLPDRLSTVETPPPLCVQDTEPQESNVELFRGRIHLGNGNRRVNAYALAPHELIEIQAEQGCGALTNDESEALSKWLHQRVLERLPQKPVGWFRRLLRLGR
jgi:hypothetical protein